MRALYIDRYIDISKYIYIYIYIYNRVEHAAEEERSRLIQDIKNAEVKNYLYIDYIYIYIYIYMYSIYKLYHLNEYRVKIQLFVKLILNMQLLQWNLNVFDV